MKHGTKLIIFVGTNCMLTILLTAIILMLTVYKQLPHFCGLTIRAYALRTSNVKKVVEDFFENFDRIILITRCFKLEITDFLLDIIGDSASMCQNSMQ